MYCNKYKREVPDNSRFCKCCILANRDNESYGCLKVEKIEKGLSRIEKILTLCVNIPVAIILIVVIAIIK